MKTAVLFSLQIFVLMVASEIVYKSSFDERQYAAFTIPENKLDVLVVSKVGLDKAAAAMDVRTGYFCDDEKLPGLAHFLEHMLFMGTKKYPTENEYSQYLSNHGGFSNAYTTQLDTNYYFEVAADAFEGALDRFAQFFVHPLFNADGVDRELLAVDSEHKKNLQNDMWRIHQVENSKGKANHPFSKFGTGSMETLKQEGIRDALVKFYGDHYSAHLMKLVVFGSESIEELKSMAIKYFKDVPLNPNAKLNILRELPFDPAGIGKMTVAKAVKDLRRLDISYQAPDMQSEYRSQPEKYITHLVGHEGHGSILSYLKKMKWATELYAGFESEGNGFQLFRISIELSRDGVSNYDRVIDAVLSYIEMLRKSQVQDWIYEECRKLSEIDFNFKESSSSSSFVSHTSRLMQNHRTSDYLSGSYLILEKRPDLVKSLIEGLNHENMRISLLCRENFDLFQGQNDIEKWYGTELKYVDIAPTVTLEGEFHFPEPSIYIPDDFKIFGRKHDQIPNVPRLLDQKHRVWYKLDDTFMLPKVYIGFSLITGCVHESVESYIAARLYCEMVDYELMEFSYSAELAGMKFQFSISNDGFQVIFRGYNQKIAEFIQSWAKQVVNLKFDEARFKIIKEDLLDQYLNFAHEEPRKMLVYLSNYLRSSGTFTVEECIEALKRIQMKDVEHQVKKWIRSSNTEVLVHGNYQENDARHMLEILRKGLLIVTDAESVKSSTPYNRVIPIGSHSIVSDPIENVNSGILVFFHFGSIEDQNIRAHGQLLGHILGEPFFDQLRTKEQLGYIVHCSYSGRNADAGLLFLIQSERSPEYLNERINDFLVQQKLSEPLEKAVFEKHVKSVYGELTETKKALNAEASNYMNVILSGFYSHFTKDRDDADYIKTNVTPESLAAFVKDYVMGSQARRLDIRTPSKFLPDQPKVTNGSAATTIISFSKANEWRQSLKRLCHGKRV